MINTNYHQPVLLQDCVNGLKIKEDGIYADVTFGGGGHSREIIKHLGPKGKLFVFDQDPDAIKNLWDETRITFIPHNFRFLRRFLKLHGVNAVDGILADLGVSSHQFDSMSRGFSIRFDAELNMRMDQKENLTAEELINTSDEARLEEIFFNYGELKEAKRLARAIVNYRASQKIKTTTELKDLAKKSMSRGEHEAKFYARVFQAIRISVNDEMNALNEFLEQCAEVLKPEGRLVIISYHSLEDRKVKNLMKTGNIEGKLTKDFFGKVHKPFNMITKKPVEPDENEIQLNSRARSAKLRIAEKI